MPLFALVTKLSPNQPYHLSNISTRGCHAFFARPICNVIFLAILFVSGVLPDFARAQDANKTPPAKPDSPAKVEAAPPSPDVPTALTPDLNVRPPGPGVVRGWWDVNSDVQTAEGHVYHLRGRAEIRGTDMVFRADEIDYDEDKGYVEARGHVFYQNYAHYEKIICDKAMVVSSGCPTTLAR